MPAQLIVFEGLDASFKETNSNRLMMKLKEDGYNTHLFHFPTYGTPGCYFVEQFLSGTYKNSNINNRTQVKSIANSIFYTLDRFDTYTKHIKSIYEEGDSNAIILLDRWCASNIFYQTAMIKNDELFLEVADKIFELEHIIYDLPIEDAIIFMDTSYEAAIKLITDRKSSDYIEDDKEWMKSVFNNTERVLSVYYNLAQKHIRHKEFRIERISTTDEEYNILSRDEIFKKVYKTALKIIGGNNNEYV